MEFRIRIEFEEQYNILNDWLDENHASGRYSMTWEQFYSRDHTKQAIIYTRNKGHCRLCEERPHCTICANRNLPLYTFEEFIELFTSFNLVEKAEEYLETGQTVSFSFLVI